MQVNFTEVNSETDRKEHKALVEIMLWMSIALQVLYHENHQVLQIAHTTWSHQHFPKHFQTTYSLPRKQPKPILRI